MVLRSNKKTHSRSFIRDGRAPIPRDPKRSLVMSAIRAKDTNPEKTLISQLRKNKVFGLRRYRKDLPGSPDLSFESHKVAVFVNGCYWHRCPYCKKPLPKTHRAFWKRKFAANLERDIRKKKELRKLGWRSVVIWECRLKKGPEREVARIKKMLDLPWIK